VREVSIRARDRINASSRTFVSGIRNLDVEEHGIVVRLMDCQSNGRALFCSSSPLFLFFFFCFFEDCSCMNPSTGTRSSGSFPGDSRPPPTLPGKHVHGASCFVSLMYSAVRDFIQLLMRPATVSGLCFFFLIRLSSKFPLAFRELPLKTRED